MYIEKGSLIKIGVSYPEINFEEVIVVIMNYNIYFEINFVKAFSDFQTGWALYNGELRHNSNSSGLKYGKSINA